MIYDVIASWIFAVDKFLEVKKFWGEKHFSGKIFCENFFVVVNLGEKNLGGKKFGDKIFLGKNKFLGKKVSS